MSNSNMAIKAYQKAVEADSIARNTGVVQKSPNRPEPDAFTETMKQSLGRVNDMQAEKKSMIQEFASGEKQNVHELMITLQKAGVAMRMTSAVRNKLMESYKEIMRMSF
jgi:flagellar hook-basal body complex protein FliE